LVALFVKIFLSLWLTFYYKAAIFNNAFRKDIKWTPENFEAIFLTCGLLKSFIGSLASFLIPGLLK